MVHCGWGMRAGPVRNASRRSGVERDASLPLRHPSIPVDRKPLHSAGAGCRRMAV